MEQRYAHVMGKSIRTRYEAELTADSKFWERQVKYLDEVRDYVTRVMEGRVPDL